MSNVPYILEDARWGARLQDKTMVDALIHGLHAGSHYIPYPMDGPIEWARGKPYIMGLTAEFLAAKYASAVYELLGKEGLPTKEMPGVNQPVMGTIGYHIRSGKHDLTLYDWQQYIRFADKHFK